MNILQKAFELRMAGVVPPLYIQEHAKQIEASIHIAEFRESLTHTIDYEECKRIAQMKIDHDRLYEEWVTSRE